MFERYGPNSLQVAEYITALSEMPPAEFAKIDQLNLDTERFIALLQKAFTFKADRATEIDNASNDVMLAVLNKGTENQIIFVSLVASLLVLEDRLTREEQVLLHLWVVDPKIPLRRLYRNHAKEDWAIKEFCEHLSRIDDHNVYVRSRPDARGQTGPGLPDFILNRFGENYTIEHTFINSYQNQVFYEKLFAKYITPLKLEDKIKAAHPNKLVHVHLPIDAFKRESDARKFDFDQLTQNLIDAVGRAPETRNVGRATEYQFPNTPFPVHISKCAGWGITFVTQIVPIQREEVPVYLTAEMSKAIRRKGEKLRAAKARGEKTVLLLDSDDYALINWEMLADAFANASADRSLFEGIDDVYIQQRGGGCWIFPVKLADRIYPDLPQFQDYWNRQAELLGVR
jgi:hypothetical protein